MNWAVNPWWMFALFVWLFADRVYMDIKERKEPKPILGAFSISIMFVLVGVFLNLLFNAYEYWSSEMVK